ncbi:MAG: Uma2 family endonuclease [Myxococcota bacterium]
MTKQLATADRELYRFCRAHRDLRIERTAGGEIIVMAPTGGETGHRNILLTVRFAAWADRRLHANGHGGDAVDGVTFDSSTGFLLPSGALRSPDLAWVARRRWDALSPEQREGFVPLCPDFAVELRSPSDSLSVLQDKCREYSAAGARLVWLVDPVGSAGPSDSAAGCVYVYRQTETGTSVAVLERPAVISGEPEMPGLSIATDGIL